MFEKILENIVLEKKRQGLTNDIIRNILKETIQYYLLDFIYNSSWGRNIIFCGGSALRFCFGLNRLSEDSRFIDNYVKNYKVIFEKYIKTMAL